MATRVARMISRVSRFEELLDGGGESLHGMEHASEDYGVGEIRIDAIDRVVLAWPGIFAQAIRRGKRVVI